MIEPTETVRNLSMSTQVTSLSRSITYLLRNIFRIRHYLDFETCNHVVRSLVLSRLDYENILLLGWNVTEIARLQRLQNWAAKIIFLAAKKGHASPLLHRQIALAACERESLLQSHVVCLQMPN